MRWFLILGIAVIRCQPDAGKGPVEPLYFATEKPIILPVPSLKEEPEIVKPGDVAVDELVGALNSKPGAKTEGIKISYELPAIAGSIEVPTTVPEIKVEIPQIPELKIPPLDGLFSFVDSLVNALNSFVQVPELVNMCHTLPIGEAQKKAPKHYLYSMETGEEITEMADTKQEALECLLDKMGETLYAIRVVFRVVMCNIGITAGGNKATNAFGELKNLYSKKYGKKAMKALQTSMVSLMIVMRESTPNQLKWLALSMITLLTDIPAGSSISQIPTGSFEHLNVVLPSPSRIYKPDALLREFRQALFSNLPV